MASNINIFGVKFAYPRGLRKSPGTNWLASCVGAQLDGKRTGSKHAQKTAFRAAVKSCRTSGR